MAAIPPAPDRRRTDFEALYQQYSREVWALVYARRMNAETAHDIVQEAFLRLWKEWGNGTAIANPRAWLLRVARNLAEDNAKSAFHRNGTCAPQSMNGLPAREALPLEKLEQKETFALLREVLAELPRADREILTMRYAFDYDTNRIAEALDINVAAIHMRLSRARQRLAERLRARGLEVSS